jgi:hypothetical protein
MANKSDLFKPGDTVPTTGIYDVIHDKLDGENHADPPSSYRDTRHGFPSVPRLSGLGEVPTSSSRRAYRGTQSFQGLAS